MESPDMQAKYQKLASEYSKLRAQNQVLKKAVVDEQGKTAHLNDLIKSRDQMLRKAEQENDSLAFRNQQLTKRLTLLQEDLDEIQSKSKRGKVKTESVGDGALADNTVFTEELQSKIQENARLQSELAEIETTYRSRLSELDTQLEVAKREGQKYREMLELREKSANEIVDQLESERVQQEVTGQQREAELRALKEQIGRLQDKLAQSATISNCYPTQPDNQDAQVSPHHTVGKPVASSNLDIPVQNGRDRSPSFTARSLVDSFDNLIQEMSKSFAKFLCSYGTRVKLYEYSSEIQEKLIEHLKSAASSWHSLASSYHQLAENTSGEGFVTLETLSGLMQVSRHVTACGASLRKVLPLVVHWVSEGSRGQVDGDRVGAAWSAAFNRLVSSWGSLAPYVATLASQSSPNSNLPPSAQGRVITMLSDRLNNLHAALREASITYQRKAANEKDLPSSSGEAKAANDEIVSVLTELSSTSNKMATMFREQVVPYWNRSGSTPSTPSSLYPSMPYSLNKSLSSSVPIPHDESHPTLCDGTLTSPGESTMLGDSEASLMKQLAVASSKLSQLEAEREHWRLEHQLLQCKHQKEAKRVRQLENQLKGEFTSIEESDYLYSKDHSASGASTTSIVGEVYGADGASDEREKDIRNHFTSRCSHLYMQLTSATSQAVLYQNECESLMRRLVVSEEKRSSCDQEIDNQRETVNQLKETLQTTSRNYEEQISTMSEHLADLNEKITAQSELIEHLKYEVKNKKGKK
ncbi:protein phosphatase 1 regulatory subunit 21 [Procambarus clarkii]|uniref:protein phosphatase 1 regulatory subunit 21 n=1 Tax=Procambarus clarkii TaxID=6728 RepID=UPI001E67585C|nr:protein phosphatase 1 regulatory subunit 21-like [Procambarus clarkii]